MVANGMDELEAENTTLTWTRVASLSFLLHVDFIYCGSAEISLGGSLLPAKCSEASCTNRFMVEGFSERIEMMFVAD